MLTTEEARKHGDATPEQRARIKTLLAERNVRTAWRLQFFKQVRVAEGLSGEAATDALVYLESLAGKDDEPTQANPAQGQALRGLVRSRLIPNSISRALLGRYDAGLLSYIEADRAIAEWLKQPRLITVPDGYYSVIELDGKPRSYRVHSDRTTGRCAVEQIIGENPERRRPLKGYGGVPILKSIADDVPAAARLYGEVRERCSDCNQKLEDTTQPGYPHGYGRDCWTKRQTSATTPEETA